MGARSHQATAPTAVSQHALGVLSGLAAGAWLGCAEAPTKFVTAGFSPFLISLGFVAGVFAARWTVPLVVRGTGSIILDIRGKPHLVIWAILAGMLWAVANTLTVFAIRDVGLSIAFPLWNTNGLVGLLWGWLLFNELREAGNRHWLKVLGGSVAILIGACLLAAASAGPTAFPAHNPAGGIIAALGAALLWGTMYIPYRKAYLSGMNPLSFVTVFTFGELGTTVVLALAFDGGFAHVAAGLSQARPALFWLFLGGFCWVLGDLFQQYAVKYVGIARGIPLSNTNQLWGLAWGALVFGELKGADAATRAMVIAGSITMAVGALAITHAEAPKSEQLRWREATERESRRYGFSLDAPAAIPVRRRWEWLLAAIALGIFVVLGAIAVRPPFAVNYLWAGGLLCLATALLAVSAWRLWKWTRFS
jgi:drug/metabolite transporter (DMT)-like permease